MNGIKLPNSLTDILLDVVRERPAMYLGEAKISNLANFIIGYMIGFQAAKDTDEKQDEYFGDNGFLEWFYKNQNRKLDSFWQIPFLEKANDDETKALLVFFEYLDKYKNEKLSSKNSNINCISMNKRTFLKNATALGISSLLKLVSFYKYNP